MKRKIKEKPKTIRVRFAPSPTGSLHIGNVRTALFNYVFAKQNKGSFVLRIEDTDKERSELKWVQEIIDQLHWLGITWDEGPDIDGKFGPYKQSQRLDIYKEYLEKLLEEKKAYYCFCLPEELEAKRQDQISRGLAPKYEGKCRYLDEKKSKEKKPFVIRFKIENKKVKFDDVIRGKIEFDAGLLGDIVIAKNLDTPLFHFAVVVDDFLMQISHIIRGEEHLSNTPRQILLQEALGFYHPTYAHIPLMLNMDKSKMSKRQGDVALKDYHDKGYLPEALINFMALLGWNPGTEKEIFSLSDLIKEFSIEKTQKSGAVFNAQRLDYLNGLYIREKPNNKLVALCLPYLIEAQLLNENSKNNTGEEFSQKTLEKIVEAYKTRLKKLSDIVELADFFFKEKLSYDKNLLKWPRLQDNRGFLIEESGQKMGDREVKESLSYSEKIISGAKNFDKKSLEELLVKEAEKFNLLKNYPVKNKGYMLWPLRVALSGKSASASPFEIAEILGREKTLKRIQDAIVRVKLI